MEIFLGNRKRGKAAFGYYSARYSLIAWVGEWRRYCGRLCKKVWKACCLLFIVLEVWSLKRKDVIMLSEMEFT